MGKLTREVESLVLGYTWDETKAPILSTTALLLSGQAGGTRGQEPCGKSSGPRLKLRCLVP